MIKIKRVYAALEPGDGYRVLVDRLWPRGLSKSTIHMNDWIKELAPSTELRKWFGHKPERWKAFRAKYRKELADEAAKESLKKLRRLARERTVTLLYGARDEEHNQAVVLKELLEKRS